MQTTLPPLALPIPPAGSGLPLGAALAPDRQADRPARPADRARPSLRERLRRPLLALFPALLAAAGAAYGISQAPYEVTDDAFVQAAKEQINARVAGQVIAVDVQNNQPVRKGQILFQLDPAPYRIAVAQAQAQLDNARLRIEALKATYHQELADLQAAQYAAGFDARDFARQNTLVAAAATPRVADDRAGTDLHVAQQHVASLRQQIASTVAALNGDPDIAISSHPAVRAAQAQLDMARLNLSYATVTAPEDGVVTGVDDLQPGDFVNPGAAAFWLLSNRHIWVEANFRETALTHMHPGEAAHITVDAYPGHDFLAHVVSMSPGTGSDFSILPPENATGNWVKVVQRLPVRLELEQIDPAMPLYAGISVTVQVDTGAPSAWRHPLRALEAVL